MRELKRSIAKANMRAQGRTKIFKRRWEKGASFQSFFARTWRAYASLHPKAKRRQREGRTKKAAV